MPASDKLAALVARFPTPAKDGKLAEVDKQATDEALARLHGGGRDAVVGLVDLLTEPAKGGDSQARHALHALGTYVRGLKEDAARRAFAAALASTLGTDRPKEVQGFVVRQLQLVGGKEVVAALGRLLADEALAGDVAQALLAIHDGAAEQFRAALPRATGRRRLTFVQALGVLCDAASADSLKPLAADKDADVRLAAVWALANLGDAGSADLLLKAADGGGYERIKATQACLLLAENLLAAGRKKEAVRIYTHLRDTRSEPAESYVRDAASRALANAG
jgi:HEAT repeat protein